MIGTALAAEPLRTDLTLSSTGLPEAMKLPPFSGASVVSSESSDRSKTRLSDTFPPPIWTQSLQSLVLSMVWKQLLARNCFTSCRIRNVAVRARESTCSCVGWSGMMTLTQADGLA